MNTSKINIHTSSSLKMMTAPKSRSKFALLGLFFLLIGFSSFAETTSIEMIEKEKETSEIRKQLYTQIQFPEFMKGNNLGEQSVEVFFRVQKNGNINVVKTDSKNESLNKFIIAEMENAQLQSLNVNEENVYKINIRFKLL